MDKEGVSIHEFVVQEAKEKSYEIEVKTLKEFEKEKNLLVDKEIEQIKEQYETKMRQVEMKHRIEHSSAINNARLQKMEARNRAMMKLFSDAQYSVFTKTKSDVNFYKDLLRKLMVQGFIKLFDEKIVYVRCLQKDKDLCSSIVDQAVSDFQRLVKQEMNKDVKLKVVVDDHRFLEERQLINNFSIPVDQYDIHTGQLEVIQKNQDDKKCFGGIVLTNKNGDIIVKNTLDVRCDLCFQDSLPDIRNFMFPNPLPVHNYQRQQNNHNH
ncbi:vacuolar ATP synthase subunit e, putative [Ichthyophthirius multifiliis]|uniref:Vacuolar ATP synthase subunit e, putative n=1 Tax=Ichthyophthirius multifiliis TaxID=5932 RepID=G0R0V4_ICHMU|nr:vacuolar ATP synthase subunit e, putative [Ichthyophthirius multifiliis]EGR28914.1 vacuolar ATP synthase subunit e, putative [Ichthyophthirius multifiliis]|eukprot:XP_004030150.1 vacuolar ATP synthase subunit e, putative [Ichthyophthirius multifiliis]